MGKYIYYIIVVVVDGCVSGHGEQKESIINGCNIQAWSNFQNFDDGWEAPRPTYSYGRYCTVC